MRLWSHRIFSYSRPFYPCCRRKRVRLSLWTLCSTKLHRLSLGRLRSARRIGRMGPACRSSGATRGRLGVNGGAIVCRAWGLGLASFSWVSGWRWCRCCWGRVMRVLGSLVRGWFRWRGLWFYLCWLEVLFLWNQLF
jgi:hypothetical protein